MSDGSAEGSTCKNEGHELLAVCPWPDGDHRFAVHRDVKSENWAAAASLPMQLTALRGRSTPAASGFASLAESCYSAGPIEQMDRMSRFVAIAVVAVTGVVVCFVPSSSRKDGLVHDLTAIEKCAPCMAMEQENVPARQKVRCSGNWKRERSSAWRRWQKGRCSGICIS